VPRKVRELKADLRRAGYQRIPRRGKGSHDSWAHPAVPGTVTISGSDGGWSRCPIRRLRCALRSGARSRQRRETSRMTTPAPHYSLIIAWSEPDQAFIVRVPELVGCVTHGATYEEAATQAQDAIAAWIDGETAMGRPIPRPRTDDAYAAVSA